MKAEGRDETGEKPAEEPKKDDDEKCEARSGGDSEDKKVEE